MPGIITFKKSTIGRIGFPKINQSCLAKQGSPLRRINERIDFLSNLN